MAWNDFRSRRAQRGSCCRHRQSSRQTASSGDPWPGRAPTRGRVRAPARVRAAAASWSRSFSRFLSHVHMLATWPPADRYADSEQLSAGELDDSRSCCGSRPIPRCDSAYPSRDRARRARRLDAQRTHTGAQMRDGRSRSPLSSLHPHHLGRARRQFTHVQRRARHRAPLHSHALAPALSLSASVICADPPDDVGADDSALDPLSRCRNDRQNRHLVDFSWHARRGSSIARASPATRLVQMVQRRSRLAKRRPQPRRRTLQAHLAMVKARSTRRLGVVASDVDTSPLDSPASTDAEATACTCLDSQLVVCTVSTDDETWPRPQTRAPWACFRAATVAGCAVRLALQMQCLRLGARFNAPVRRDRQARAAELPPGGLPFSPSAICSNGLRSGLVQLLLFQLFSLPGDSVPSQSPSLLRLLHGSTEEQRDDSGDELGAQHTVPAQRRYRSARVRVRRRLQSRNARRLLIGESPFHSDASRRQLLRRYLRHA